MFVQPSHLLFCKIGFWEGPGVYYQWPKYIYICGYTLLFLIFLFVFGLLESFKEFQPNTNRSLRSMLLISTRVHNFTFGFNSNQDFFLTYRTRQCAKRSAFVCGYRFSMTLIVFCLCRMSVRVCAPMCICTNNALSCSTFIDFFFSFVVCIFFCLLLWYFVWRRIVSFYV